MGSPSPERGRSRTRSHTPTAAKVRSPPRDQSPRRSISPRSASRSRTPTRSPSVHGRERPNGVRGGRSRSRSPSRTPSRSRSRGRGERNYRDRSYTHSASPVPRSSKIVVERLTKNVHEGHLREIFGAYGSIRDVDLPMNKQFMTNRATAYIVYAEAPDAEAAIAHMHEAQLDGAVISVSIVLPRRKFSRSPPPSRTNPPAFDRDRYNERGPPAPRGYRGGPPPPSYSGRYRSPTPPRRGPPPRRYDSPPRRYDSPPRRYGGRAYPRDRDRDRDTYRPRSYSRSRSPSYSSRSRSRTPPRRSGGRGRTPPPPRGGRKRRSPSYSSYSSYSDRSRSRSRGKYGRR